MRMCVCKQAPLNSVGCLSAAARISKALILRLLPFSGEGGDRTAPSRGFLSYSQDGGGCRQKTK